MANKEYVYFVFTAAQAAFLAKHGIEYQYGAFRMGQATVWYGSYSVRKRRKCNVKTAAWHIDSPSVCFSYDNLKDALAALVDLRKRYPQSYPL